MEINVDSNSKIVEIWLTKAEKYDAELRGSLKPIYTDYAAQKYTVAVLESGDKELHDDVHGLIMQNQKLEI